MRKQILHWECDVTGKLYDREEDVFEMTVKRTNEYAEVETKLIHISMELLSHMYGERSNPYDIEEVIVEDGRVSQVLSPNFSGVNGDYTPRENIGSKRHNDFMNLLDAFIDYDW